MVSPVQKKIVIETFVSTGSCGVARACRLFGLSRSAVYRSGKIDVVKMAQEGLVVETSRAQPPAGGKSLRKAVGVPDDVWRCP